MSNAKTHLVRNVPPKAITVGGADRAVRSPGSAKLKTGGSAFARPTAHVTSSKGKS